MQNSCADTWVDRALPLLREIERDLRTNHERGIRELWARLTASSPALSAHARRTGLGAIALGQTLGLGDAELIDLGYAGLLHDIGLLTLPPGADEHAPPLAADDYARFQSHPRAGAAMLHPFPRLKSAALYIAHHHERWDGYGYPYGLRGKFIPLGARILVVADLYDALQTSEGSASPPGSHVSAALLQAVSGSVLDPYLVRVFTRLLNTVSEPGTVIL